MPLNCPHCKSALQESLYEGVAIQLEIYGPDRQPLARDLCGDKNGTNYLRGWIAAETSLPLRALLSGGADAETPLPLSR